MLRQQQLEHDGPHEKWNQDLMNLRGLIVSPNPADTGEEDDNRYKAWDAKQIIEVIVKKTAMN